MTPPPLSDEAIQQLQERAVDCRRREWSVRDIHPDILLALLAEVQASRQQIALLIEAVTAANTSAVEIRTLVWSVLDGRTMGGDRTLVSMVRTLVSKLEEARDNRRGEFELRMQVEAESRQRQEKHEVQASRERWQEFSTDIIAWCDALADDGAEDLDSAEFVLHLRERLEAMPAPPSEDRPDVDR